jgi:secreted Zn-dependent insulinase-like peptidase
LTVGVGSESDIEGFVGFTHLIEHLLFTGSRNFPEEHHIEKIVNKHQGEQNGVTKAFTTSYYFKIDKSGLEEFLPALVDAIQNPTFAEADILKEINNVNSEISMRMTYNKHLAYYKLLKRVGNPASKLFQDGFSNIDASAVDVKALREQLIEFHKRHYSANIMTLSVVSDDSFKETRARVEREFAVITDKKVQRSFFNTTAAYAEPLLPEVFQRVFYVQGFTEPSKLTLVFRTKSDLATPDFRALDFFSFFLNYFAENSFKQVLVKRNLITSLSDTIALQDFVDSIYTVSFSLTPLGLENATEVLREFFRFVEFIRRLPDKERIFQDLSKASKYSFLFGVKSEFMDFSQVDQNYFDRVVDFSETIMDNKPELIFTANNVMFRYNETAFMDALKALNSHNMLIMVESPKFRKKGSEEEDSQFEVIKLEPEKVEVVEEKEGERARGEGGEKSVGEGKEGVVVGGGVGEGEGGVGGGVGEGVQKDSTSTAGVDSAAERLPPNNTSPSDQSSQGGIQQKQNLKKALPVADALERTTAERNLELSTTASVSKRVESTEEVLNRFFDLRDSALLGKHPSAGRVLEEGAVSLSGTKDAVLSEAVQGNPRSGLNGQLDGLHHRVVLDQSFDFDNGRMFTSEEVRQGFHLEVEPVNDLVVPQYDTCRSFDTTHLDHYVMVTRCRPPKSLSTLVKSEVQSTDEVMDYVKEGLGEGELSQGIRTEKLFQSVFNDGPHDTPLAERYSILRDLLVYKLCIVQEFENDDKQVHAKTLLSTDPLNAYHSLFRKTLQPKVVVVVAIESQTVLTSVVGSSFDDRVEKTLLMEVLCMYIMRHVEFHHREEFLRGNDFRCSAVNFRAVLEFQGFSEHMKDFMAKILGSLKQLTDSSAYREYLISNFQQRIVHLYSQFSAISSLKLSTFYLNLVMDKIFIDNSTPQKVQQVVQLVARITPQTLGVQMTEILSENRMLVLGVGNADEASVRQWAAASREAIPGSRIRTDKTIDFDQFRKFTFDNFVMAIDKDEHLMLRLSNVDQSESNSVYLTYFAINRMSRSVKVHALILNHFLKKLVYDHLRNNLNLGYVTQSGLKSYYRVS